LRVDYDLPKGEEKAMSLEKITVSDGAELSAIVEGSGPPLVLVPGWSQSAAEFKHQIEAFSNSRTVIALNMRGHGGNKAPETGYRIQRFAKDLYDVIVAKSLDRADVLGHSMGCSIIYAYHSMFSAERPLGKLILVDEAALIVAKHGMDEEQKLNAGCFLPDLEALGGFMEAVVASNTAEATKEVIRGMFSGAIDESELAWVAEENVKLPRDKAAELLFDHALIDWSSEIKAIRNPALVVGGDASLFPAQSQRWIASQIPGARLEIFGADEGGSHFMFWENPEKFNALVSDFLTG